MIDDRDIWRAANLRVKRYGADGATEAAERADELSAEGDSASPRLMRIGAPPSTQLDEAALFFSEGEQVN